MEAFPDKVRLRTSVELSEQFEGLLKVCAVLEICELDWFLSGGTLLGAVREQEFIPWDWDVEVTIMTEQARSQGNKITSELAKVGFQIWSRNFSNRNFKVVAGGFGTKFEIVGLRLKGNDLRARKMMEVSAKLFEAKESVQLRGHLFPAPQPAVDYLGEVYGDWRIPKRTAVKSEYLTPRANLKPPFLSIDWMLRKIAAHRRNNAHFDSILGTVFAHRREKPH